MEQLLFPVTRRESERRGIRYSTEKNKNAKFPSRLRELRERMGISQSSLSKELGVSKSTVGLWETGDTIPDAKAIYDLSNYFGVNTDYLLCKTDIASTDANVKEISEKTGLSEKIADFLISDDAFRRTQMFGFNQIMDVQFFYNICTLLLEYVSSVDSVSAENANYMESGDINSERYIAAVKRSRYKRLELVDYLTNILISYSAEHGVNDRAYGVD